MIIPRNEDYQQVIDILIDMSTEHWKDMMRHIAKYHPDIIVEAHRAVSPPAEHTKEYPELF